MNFKKGSFMALSNVGKGKNKHDFPAGTIFGKNLRGQEHSKIPTPALIYGTYAIHKDGRAGQGDWTVSDCWSGMVIQYFSSQKQAKHFVTKIHELMGGSFPITSYSDWDFAPIMDFIDMPRFIEVLTEARAL